MKRLENRVSFEFVRSGEFIGVFEDTESLAEMLWF